MFILFILYVSVAINVLLEYRRPIVALVWPMAVASALLGMLTSLTIQEHDKVVKELRK